MTADTIQERLTSHATQLENHAVRIGTLEDFVRDYRKGLNRITVGLLLAGAAALLDLAVRR